MVHRDRTRLGPKWFPALLTIVVLAALALGLTGLGMDPALAKNKKKKQPKPDLTFSLVRSEEAESAGCLGGVSATAQVFLEDQAERLVLSASGLPRNVAFTVFVIQVPNAPFGLVWYQGDLVSDSKGNARVTYIGRFSVESFIDAPGAAAPTVLHGGDAANGTNTNGAVHTFHLGVWFDDPADAAAAGCPGKVTPFNDVHQAGIQALSTRNEGAAAGDGPLRDIG